jgi:1-acyl-sn-glycerol-3-phosphate acyltransferase
MSLWLPESGCGADCLRDDEAPSVGPLRQAGRLIGLLGVLLGAAVLVPALAVLRPRWRAQITRDCARAALRVLGIGHTWRGTRPVRGALLVANHISWLDILVLMAEQRPPRLVAKAEVRGWPLLGWIARYTGSIFIDRARPRTLPETVALACAALAQGETVAVFPEGTTSCGVGTGGFRPAFFQAAIDTGAAVVPLTLRYRAAGVPTPAPAFIGDDTLLASLRRVLAVRRLGVQVSAGAAIHPAPIASRRMLAKVASLAVGSAGVGSTRVGSARVAAHAGVGAQPAKAWTPVTERPAQAPTHTPVTPLPVGSQRTPADSRTPLAPAA